VDSKYGDGKAFDRMSFQASRLNICQYLPTLPKGTKRQYGLPHGAASKSILSVKYHYFDGPLNPQLMDE